MVTTVGLGHEIGLARGVEVVRALGHRGGHCQLADLHEGSRGGCQHLAHRGDLAQRFGVVVTGDRDGVLVVELAGHTGQALAVAPRQDHRNPRSLHGMGREVPGEAGGAIEDRVGALSGHG